MARVQEVPKPSENPVAAPVLSLRRFEPAKRRALSGPGLRTFLNVANEWKLTEEQRLLVLGSPARSTFHDWVRKVRRGEEITLSVDVLTRISAVLGIYKALRIIFSRPEDASTWLRSPNRGPVFGGQSPLALIACGMQDGLTAVRRHLDAWRGGMFAAPVQGFDGVVAPITDDDLVFA
jgi:Antitoxin Xre/MbcA/ParS C-terminal toxin-binding domain/Antitoxin Xre-like helix-turn-helix domain